MGFGYPRSDAPHGFRFAGRPAARCPHRAEWDACLAKTERIDGYVPQALAHLVLSTLEQA